MFRRMISSSKHRLKQIRLEIRESHVCKCVLIWKTSRLSCKMRYFTNLKINNRKMPKSSDKTPLIENKWLATEKIKYSRRKCLHRLRISKTTVIVATMSRWRERSGVSWTLWCWSRNIDPNTTLRYWSRNILARWLSSGHSLMNSSTQTSSQAAELKLICPKMLQSS